MKPNKVAISIRLPASLASQIKDAAARNLRSVNSEVIAKLTDACASNKKQEVRHD